MGIAALAVSAGGWLTRPLKPIARVAACVVGLLLFFVLL